MRRSSLVATCSALGALVALTSLNARADPNTTAAQTLFEEGRRLMQAGDYAAACPKLAESQRLDPGAGTLLNLAACYEKREQLASAWITYTEAASDADRSNRPEWVKKARERAAALHSSLSTLTITVAPEARAPGLEVLRDGHVVATAEHGVKVPVDGGEHLVEARAPGYQSWSTKVVAPTRNGAEKVTVPSLVELEPAKTTSAARSPEDARPGRGDAGRTQRIVGAGLAIGGVVGLAVGGLFTSLAISKHDEAKGNCTADEALCNPDGLAQYDDAGRLANVATGAFIAGGVLLAGGLVLYLVAPRSAASNGPTAFPNGFRWTF